MTIDRVTTCTGCMMCLSSCPVNAISVKDDILRGKVPWIDYSECIECDRCIRICPEVNDDEKKKTGKVYAAFNKKNDAYMRASSGGVFACLAEYVISQGGIVVGAAWTNNKNVEHIIIDNLKDINLLQKSKYLQSSISKTIFLQIENALKSNRLVLFSGTPCQVAGMKRYKKKYEDKLVLLDIVCHGVIPGRVFETYIDYLENRYNIDILSFDFRHKDRRMGQYLNKITYKKKNTMRLCEYIGTWNMSSYFYTFMMGYMYRESCYQCKYSTKERVGDITLGDFWGIKAIRPELHRRHGLSLVIVNNELGNRVMTNIMKSIEVHEINDERALADNPQLSHPCTKPNDNEQLMQEYKKKGYKAIAEKYKRARSGRCKSKCILLVKKIYYFGK